MRRLALLTLLALALVTASRAQAPKDTLKTLTYAELGQKVRDLKGKVVVVYFWSFTCAPCKAHGVPTLIKMQEKYGKDLVVIGVLLDEKAKPDNAALVAGGMKYLGKQKPPFEMVYLDFPNIKFWQDKLGNTGYPTVFVFNRDNQYVKKLPVLDEKGKELEAVDYDVVEKAVADLMKK